MNRQVPTQPVTIAEIVGDPAFRVGLSDFFNGRPLPPFDRHWEYERGRLFGAACIKDGIDPMSLSRKEQVALAGKYFLQGEIL